MKVRVIGEIEAKNDYGKFHEIPRGIYNVSLNGVVFLNNLSNRWTLFLTNFQNAIKNQTIQIIEEE